MIADVHVRIDVSSLLCVGAAAAAVYGAVRYLQWRSWPAAATDSSGKPCSGKDAAAALKAQLLQLHYASAQIPAPEADADVPEALQAIITWSRLRGSGPCLRPFGWLLGRAGNAACQGPDRVIACSVHHGVQPWVYSQCQNEL